MVPFFDAREAKLGRVLTDRGTERCGAPERHEHELRLAAEDIDHPRTKTESPQANGIVERLHETVLHETVLDERCRVALRKTAHASVAELQADLDAWMGTHDEEREHQGRWRFGTTPRATFLDARPLALTQGRWRRRR